MAVPRIFLLAFFEKIKALLVTQRRLLAGGDVSQTLPAKG